MIFLKTEFDSQFIDNFNSQNNSYELGINQFTDLNHKEFKSYNSNNLI